MIALASFVLAAMDLFTDFGLNRSITREPDGDTPHFLRVAWAFKILRGIAIAIATGLAGLALWFLAPILASPDTVYGKPEMPLLIALTGFSALFAGFASTNQELTQRRMDQKSITILMFVSQVLGILTMIVLAWFSPTVWALLAGMISNKLFFAVMTHFYLSGPSMRWEWNWEIFWRLWHFGKWLLGSSALTFFGRNADKLIIAALVSPTTLGIYAIAQIWVRAGLVFLQKLSQMVGFPAIADVIRNRPDELPKVYGKFQKAIDLICVTAFLFCAFLGDPIMKFLYPPAYDDAGGYLVLMSPSFLLMRFDPIMAIVLNFGNSKAMMVAAAIRAAAMIILVPVGFHFFGMTGAVVGAAIAPAFVAPYSILLTKEYLGTRTTQLNFAWLIASLMITAIMVVWAT